MYCALNGKFVKSHMLSHRNQCKRYNMSVVVIDKGFTKIGGFVFDTW